MRFLLSAFALVSLSFSPVISAAGGIGEYCCDAWACAPASVQTCQTGLSCCYSRPVWMQYIGGTCYDPTVSTCADCPVYNPNHGQTQVCPKTAPTCCGDCIDSTKQCCHAYGTYDFHTCDPDQICCGLLNGQPSCCSSDQQCVNDMCVNPPSCPSDTQVCGTSCYKSSEYVCADTSRGILCPTSNPSLCGDACYSEAEYGCLNGALQPLQTGGNPTPTPTTGPTTASTPAPGCVLPGDLKCGTRCYSPTTHVCADAGNSQLCPVDYPLACGDACYSASQYTCVGGQLSPVMSGTQGPTAVPGCVLPGDLKCGTRCYSPTTHVCADAGSSFLCPVAYPSKCGDACYSSTQYTCVDGQLQGV